MLYSCEICPSYYWCSYRLLSKCVMSNMYIFIFLEMAHLDIRPANIFLAQSPSLPPSGLPMAPITTLSPCSSSATPRASTSFSAGIGKASSLARSFSFRETSIFASSQMSQSQGQSQSQQGCDSLPPPVPVDDVYIRKKRSFDTSMMPMAAPMSCGDDCSSRSSSCVVEANAVVAIDDPLLVARNIASGAWQVKVGDLGKFPFHSNVYVHDVYYVLVLYIHLQVYARRLTCVRSGLCCSFNDYSSFTEGEGRYCAGELINGASGSQDFAKADMFSVGASLLEMCTGQRLAAGGGEDGLEWHALRDGTMTEVICAEGGCEVEKDKWPHRTLEGYSNEVRSVLREVSPICFVDVFECAMF
jgi:serine/threonine protein kinase